MKKIIAIAVILAGVVLLTIGNTIQMYSTISIIEKRLADKERAVDTVSAKVDTLTFEQEMDIVDSAIKAQEGIVYKSIYEIPNREVSYKYGGWHQTIVRHPNGMPKIATGIGRDEKGTGLRVYGCFLLFLDENGRLIAQGERPKSSKLGFWHCEAQPDTLVRFNFSNPNKCMNLK